MKKVYIYMLLVTGLLFGSCEREPQLPPENPYDSIVYPEPPMPMPEPDSSSLIGLHKYIFSQSCAVPGCHDGHFEPDFRTVQSSYSSLVFQPVIKNTSAGEFTWRVKPFDVDASWLHHRVTTTNATLGRMPLYDNPLTSGQIKAIENWINDGAPDMFGNVSSLPNQQPAFGGLAAFIHFGPVQYRVDTIRGDEPYLPFAALPNSEMTIWLAVNDDSTDISALTNSKLVFSESFDDFSNSLTVDAQYVSSPKIIPDYYGPGQEGVFHWKVDINTSDVPAAPFEPGSPEISFFRYYTEDGHHTEPMEFPRDQHPIEFKLYMSFFLVP